MAKIILGTAYRVKIGAFVLLFLSASANTKLAEDVNSSRDFEDGTAAAVATAASVSAAVFGGNFGARKEEPAAAADSDDATLLFKAPSSGNRGNGTKEGRGSEGGRPQGGPRKGNFGECGPAAAVNRHEPIIRDAARVARMAGPEFLQRYR